MTEPMPPIEPRTRDNITTERVFLPRITIKFCTQCKWMLRAAYFAQELLSTFNTDLGEVALIPTTGGIFTVTMYHSSSAPDDDTTTTTNETVIWDRKTNGGFPEVKHLKSLVRNIIDPSRDLGHTDRALRAANVPAQTQKPTRTESGASQDVNPGAAAAPGEKCEDCQ